ncbi:MAG: hypothetical protein IJ313_12810 [Clostridia bacterium]|nr:hypothetical protein [Clostridia bacterium]
MIPVCGISQESLDLLLRLYDGMFLSHFLKRLSVHVTLSSRLTSSAGKFLFARGPFGQIRQAEIRMSSDFLLRLNQGPFELNGLSVATPQEAFLLVFEHELVHAVETLLYGQTGHSQRFLSLANGLFGHTATRHKLPTRQHEAAQQGLLVGTRVSFSHANQELTGIVTYIGKMATVMVPSSRGEYRDRRGVRYVKYRVPLNRIRKA